MISVIVPVYNVFPFLGECIESICGQTFTDLEIILVDDGSTDQSGILCDNYAKRDTRIRVIHQKNQGLSGARNAGIVTAQGEYIVFADSDDRMNPGMIRTLYDAMQKYDAELAICSHKVIRQDEPEALVYKEVTPNNEDIEILPGRECVKRIYSSEAVDMTVAWNKLYKRSMFKSLKYPVGRLHEDEFLTYKILYFLNKCVYIKLPLYEYRMREDSIMGSKSFRRLRDKIDVMEERCLFFEQKNDKQLYYEALRRYETSIAEFIFYLQDIGSENAYMRELENRFKEVYRNKIRFSPMALQHKLKFILFMQNHALYKYLKNIGGRKLKNHY